MFTRQYVMLKRKTLDEFVSHNNWKKWNQNRTYLAVEGENE